MTEELLKERKEAMLALINDPTYVPMKIKELAMLLDVPREKRDEILLVTEGAHVLWTVGGRISAGYKVSEHTKRILEVQFGGGKGCE